MIRNSESYKNNCKINGTPFNQEFYEILLKADLKREKMKAQENELYKKTYKKTYTKTKPNKKYVYRAHPDSMDETLATILYLFVMVFGSIFNGRLFVWIIATIIFVNFKTSHYVEKGDE